MINSINIQVSIIFFCWSNFSFCIENLIEKIKKENKFPAFVKVLKGTYLFSNDYVKQDNQFLQC